MPFSTISNLCAYFNVPLDFFAEKRALIGVQGRADQDHLHHRTAAYTSALRSTQMDMLREGQRISTDSVLNWIKAENHTLRNFDALRERVDLFFPIRPEDRIMRPFRLGHESLARKSFRLQDEDHFTKLGNSFDPGLLRNVMQAHADAERLPYQVSDEAIEVELSGRRERFSYRRVMSRVKDLAGAEYTLVFALPL